MRHATTAALLTAAVLAGCGESTKVGQDVADAEIALNASPQDTKAQATTPTEAATAMANEGIAGLKGDWKLDVPKCQPSGPVESCDIVIRGEVTCTTRAAVRVLTSGVATAKRVPYICKES